jgi:IclR family acetate operon transcriptional repressor
VLGVKIPWLNNTFRNSIKPEITLIEELNSLQKSTGETVYLLGVQENHIIMQAIVEGMHAIKVNTLYEGYSGNYHARASTKSIIAYWSEVELDSYFKNYEFAKITDKTPSNLTELKGQLNIIRTLGYCLDEEETVLGICFISAPIFNSSKKPIGSYALSIPRERYLARKQELIESVVQAANKASMFMGYVNTSNMLKVNNFS